MTAFDEKSQLKKSVRGAKRCEQEIEWVRYERPKRCSSGNRHSDGVSLPPTSPAVLPLTGWSVVMNCFAIMS